MNQKWTKNKAKIKLKMERKWSKNGPKWTKMDQKRIKNGSKINQQCNGSRKNDVTVNSQNKQQTRLRDFNPKIA